MEAEPLTGTWLENETSFAPPPFMVAGNTATPIEVRRLELVFEIDPSQQSAVGHARLRFNTAQAGRPLLDLVPRATKLSLDGQQLDPEKLRLVIPPDENTPLRMVDQHLEPGEHTLELTHPLRDATVQFVNGGARLGLFMTDLDPRGYLESHAPANLELTSSSSRWKYISPAPPPRMNCSRMEDLNSQETRGASRFLITSIVLRVFST